MSVWLRGQGGEFKQSIPLTVERTIFLVDAALLWILLLQSKSLGITWKSSVAEITIGFVLYLTVQATALLMIELDSDNNLVVDIANAMGQFALSNFAIELDFGRCTIATQSLRVLRHVH